MDKDALLGALKSKTVWVNGAVGMAGVLDMLASNTSTLTALFPGLAPYMALFGAVNVILRFFTTKPLAEKA